MENKFAKMAVENHINGCSCSESIVKAAADSGLVPDELINAATSFSGGMSHGCLCGAIAGSQMVIGFLFGKYKNNTARKLAKEFLDEFKKTHKASCCRVLTAGMDFASAERKAHCNNSIADCASILERILQRELSKV